METNLFSDDVVIIIGAGASVPFGLPTGLGLIDLVSKSIKDEAALCKRTNGYCEKIIYAGNFNNGKQLFEIDLNIKNKWLDAQVSDSIDDLIRHNSLEANWLKYCIVYEILKCTHSKNESKMFHSNGIHKYVGTDFKIKNFTDRKINSLRNWVHNFINIVRDLFIEKWKTNDDYRESYEFRNKKNYKVKVISFNYDGILEHILSKCWGETQINLPKWDDVFEIVHPHGTMGIKEEINSEEIIEYLRVSSKKIVVVKEPIDDGSKEFLEVISWRTRAKEIIENASQVMAIGFAFAKSNCDLIGLEKGWVRGLREDNNKIHFINFDDNFGLRERVRSIREYNGPLLSGSGAPIDYDHGLSEMKPLKGDYLQITDAIMGGFLGEMPS